ncbi:MAG: hypothetical protein M3Y74_19995 [Chloroflexota bacterium]|nr:hypothetical protein [Chloroflexota bacterium]
MVMCLADTSASRWTTDERHAAPSIVLMPGAALFAGGQVLGATAYILDVQFTPRDLAIYQTLAPPRLWDPPTFHSP